MSEDAAPGEYVDFNKLKSNIRHFTRKRDWEKYDNPKDLAIAISVEAGELLEVFRWLHENELDKIRGNVEVKERIKKELEQVIEKCRKMAKVLGVELDE